MTEGSAARTAVGFRSERGPVLIGLMLTTGLVAIDSTIIATAVPSVVHDLGGFSQFPWLFSVYLLTQAVTVPLYGRAADLLGRRPVMFVGIGIFLVASVLCGLAWGMGSLIAFRALQGIGAGAIQPIAMTIVGDMYTVEERARVQGYLASVWGISSVIGPALGGVFSQYLSWRWIFFVNIPIGLLATFMLMRHFHESVVRRRHQMDYAGAVLLMAGFSLLILGLLEGGSAWAWSSRPGVAVLGSAAVLLTGFVLVERRAAEPVLPLWVFRHRTLAGGSLAALVVGALLIGLTSYVPTYVQGVLGADALVAGFAVAALTLGWPIAAAYSGRLYLPLGFRDTALIGSAVVVVGGLMCVRLGPHSPVLEVAAACFVVGVGLGLASSPTIVAVQSVVGWDRRGVVTGSVMFCRSLGMAVGAAVFGAIANATLASRFADAPSSVAGHLPNGVDATSQVLESDAAARHTEVGRYIQDALYAASHHVFIGTAVVALVTAAAVLVMPRHTEPLEI